MYPKIQVDLEKLKHNAKEIDNLCKKANCTTSLVTKAFCADINIIKELDKLKVDYFADSRVKNLKKMKDMKTKKMLLRIPMQNEIEDVIRYSDISLNSELKTVKLLNEFALKEEKLHEIILMVDLGDLREGYFSKEDLFKDLGEILNLKNIKIMGLGVNLTCYGAVIPKNDNLTLLCNIAEEIRNMFNLELPIISGGNSSSIYLIDKNELPKGISNLRVGEAFLLGRETAYGNDLKNLYQDVFELQCQIVEIKEKPSLPIGEIGVDAFGNVPYYEDKGVRRRAILAIGQQDTDIESLNPKDQNILILGASSDHLLIDITDSDYNYDIGDIVTFKVGYGALLKGFTSEYVSKDYI